MAPKYLKIGKLFNYGSLSVKIHYLGVVLL